MKKNLLTRVNAFLEETLLVLGRYLSGQFNVALVLALFYAVCFHLIGLKPAILLGIGLGVLSFIPLLGGLLGIALCLVLAYFQFGEWLFVLYVFGIYITGQLAETYYLTPKFLGKKTGVHPLFVFVVIMIGGAFFGPLGMVLALPVGLIAFVALKHFKVYTEDKKKIKNLRDKKISG